MLFFFFFCFVVVCFGLVLVWFVVFFFFFFVLFYFCYLFWFLLVCFVYSVFGQATWLARILDPWLRVEPRLPTVAVVSPRWGPPGNSQPQGVFLKEEKKKQMGLTPLGGSWRRGEGISREASSLFLKIRWNRRALRAIREECSSWSVASRTEQDLQDGPWLNLRWCLPVLAGTGC